MSGLEQDLYLELLARGRWIVTTGEAMRCLGVRRLHASKILHGLSRKGAIARAGRGLYAVAAPGSLRSPGGGVAGVEPFRALDQLMKELGLEYYAGFVTACFLHGAADEIPFAVDVASARGRRPLRLGDTPIRFHRLAPELLFGTERIRQSGEYLTVSDREKTLLDCAYRLDLSGGAAGLAGIAAELAPTLDVRRFRRHVQRFPRGTWARRLGHTLDRLGGRRKLDADRDLLHAVARRVGGGTCRLDPWGSVRGPVDQRWGVVANVRIAG